MDKHNIESIYPLNNMQEALLFHCLHPGTSDAGFLQVRYNIHGNLFQEAFESAWSKVLQRHESLRMSLHVAKARKPMLVVSKSCEAVCRWEDIRHLSADEKQKWLESYCEKDREEGLQLSQSPVSRIIGVRTADDQHQIVWSCHHLLLDGWSSVVILQELFKLYQCERTDNSANLDSPVSQREYFRWLKNNDSSETTSFWGKYLHGFAAPNSLANLCVAEQHAVEPQTTEPLSASVTLDFSTEEGLKIERAAASLQVTPAAIASTAWTLFLSALSESRDILFGNTNSGRHLNLSGRETMTGFFANVIPKRCFIDPNATVAHLAQAIHRDQYATQPHEHFSLSDIHQCSEVQGAQPLFESLLVFENLPWQDIHLPIDGGLTLCNYSTGVTTTYPLTLIITPQPDWSMHYLYDPTRLSGEVVRKSMRLFPELLKKIADATSQKSQVLLEWLAEQLPRPRTDPTHNNSPCIDSGESLNTPRNRTELEISKIWGELLGISNIDIHADFLSLGGRSIAAVRMLSMIEDRFDKRIALADLIEQPTIAHLASKVDGDIQPGTWKTLVPIQPQGSKKPLFFVHAGGGHVLFLRALVPHLGLDQPFHGLQPIGLDGECLPASSIEAMATQYLAELQAIQPIGPYHLVGHCLGAIVAFEMAQQLLRRGEQIGMLVVLDTTPPTIGSKHSPAEQLQDNGTWHQVINGRWVAVAKTIGANGNVRLRAQKSRLAKFVKRKWILTYGSSLQKKEFNLKAVRKACMRAFLNYSARPYAGSITLIRTRDAREIHLGWGKLTEDFDSLALPVGHSTIFLEPDVQLLAEALTQLVEATERVNHASSRNS